MPSPYFIPGRGIGGWVAHMIDYKSWTLSAGIWGGGEIMVIDASETTTGKCTYYIAAAADLNIIGLSATGNEHARKYKTAPEATPPTDPPEDLVAIIDLARGACRLANDSNAITHGDLVQAEQDTQTIEEVAAQTLTAVDLAVITVIADATAINGANGRTLFREINSVLGRANEDQGANTDDAVAIEVTLLLNRPEIVVPSA